MTDEYTEQLIAAMMEPLVERENWQWLCRFELDPGSIEIINNPQALNSGKLLIPSKLPTTKDE